MQQRNTGKGYRKLKLIPVRLRQTLHIQPAWAGWSKEGSMIILCSLFTAGCDTFPPYRHAASLN